MSSKAVSYLKKPKNLYSVGAILWHLWPTDSVEGRSFLFCHHLVSFIGNYKPFESASVTLIFAIMYRRFTVGVVVMFTWC